MTRGPGAVLRAGVAGAAVMTAFGTVEIWFTELSDWAFHRGGFAPLERPFAVLLFLLFPLAGALAAALVAAAAAAVGAAVDGRAVGAAVVVVAHAVFRLPAYAGGSFVLLLGTNALLLAAAVAVSASPHSPLGLRVLTGPWTVALLLGAPPWVMTELLAATPRPVRALGFAATACAAWAAAFAASRAAPRARPFVAASVFAAAATLAAVLLVDSAAPRQAAERVTPAARGPNVLLVVLDTVRADHLSLYGYPRDTTPRLRRFAESATVYTQARAPSNMTLATHASLFTGLAASEHRAHYDAGRPAGRPLGTSIPTLAEIFATRGYDVSSVAGNYGFLGPGFGLDRGFAWSDARARRSTLGVVPGTSVRGAFRRLLCRALGRCAGGDTRARGAGEITQLAIGRIDRARALGRPYFLFVNYFDAHERVLVPPPFAGSFSGPSARPTGPDFDALLHEMNRTGRVVPSAGDREALVARYDETLAYVDASLDRLLAHAVSGASGGDTLVVVTSDHGEAWGEHATLGHGSTLYDEQVRVPLVVREPRQTTGRVVERPVGLASVFRLLTTGSMDAGADEPVVSESFPLVPTPEKPGVRGGRALFRGSLACLRGIDGRLELYDVRNDPGQSHDLSAAAAFGDARAEASARLDGWIAAHEPVRSPEVRESPEDRARLRALGYLR